MQERKYFGTDGIRGKVGAEPITPSFVLKLGWAAGKVLAETETSKVLIGKDTRISGYMLETALESGFIAAGIDVELMGPMPTPAVAYLTSTLRAEAGVVISASHNPFYDNGIKFFNAKGNKLPDEMELKIEALIDQPMQCVPSEHLGKASRLVDAAGRYIEFCKSHFPNDLSLKGLKIVVDCANGATYHIAPNVLRELGAEVVEIGVDPDGFNINDGCGATQTDFIKKTVLNTQANIGIALDGDGDRLMMVDHKGNVLDGDEIVFIIARESLRNGTLQGSGVVGTQMSNLGLEVALTGLGIPFVRAKVGDRYVTEKLLEKQWFIGGENSGHIINLHHAPTGDAIVSAIQVLTTMCRSGLSLHELRNGMEKFPQELINVRTEKACVLTEEKVQKVVASVEAKLQQHGRVLLRKSGTEPVVRVMVEGKEQTLVKQCAHEIAATIKEFTI